MIKKVSTIKTIKNDVSVTPYIYRYHATGHGMCLFLVIDGHYYSFPDLGNNLELNPHGISGGAIRRRHALGTPLSMLFASKSQFLRYRQALPKKYKIAIEDTTSRAYCKKFQSRLNQCFHSTTQHQLQTGIVS